MCFQDAARPTDVLGWCLVFELNKNTHSFFGLVLLQSLVSLTYLGWLLVQKFTLVAGAGFVDLMMAVSRNHIFYGTPLYTLACTLNGSRCHLSWDLVELVIKNRILHRPLWTSCSGTERVWFGVCWGLIR